MWQNAEVPKDKRDITEMFQAFGEQDKLDMEVQEFQKRSRQFLSKKGVEKGHAGGNRGSHWHRQKAFDWLVNSHNHMEWSADIENGWEHFLVDQSDDAATPHWRAWPTATLCCDQGGDGNCAAWFLKSRGCCILKMKECMS